MEASINEWVEEQLDGCDDSFNYFDFIVTFHFTDPREGDLAYHRTLNNVLKAATHDKQVAQIIQKAIHNFNQRKDPGSPFGCDYELFWAGTIPAETEKRMEKRTHDTIKNVNSMVMQSVERIVKKACNDFTRHCADSGSRSVSTSNYLQDPSSIKIEKQDEADCQTTALTDATCRSREELLKHLGQFGVTESLGIIDLNSDEINGSTDEVQIVWSEALKLPAWVPDVWCERFIKKITSSSSNPQMLRIKARQQDPELLDDFDICLHYNLRALEIITDTCLDMIQAPKNIMDHEVDETTLAVEITIPFINSLFRHFNDIIEVRWLEDEVEPFDMQKWDGLGLSKSKNEDVVGFLLELSGGTSANGDRVRSDKFKLYRKAQRSVNYVTTFLSDRHPARVFLCRYHNKILYFESLTLIKSRKYILQHHVEVKIPQTGQEIQDLLQKIHLVFGWRDAVVQQARNLRAFHPLGVRLSERPDLL